MSTLFILDIIGTFVFAVSGVAAAVERKFDLFGTIILAFVTAVGGGTLRDVLLGAKPVSWMNSDLHILVILCAIPVAFFFSKMLRKLRKTFLLFDTIGIGLFTILGIEKALSMGMSPIVSIMMGVVSAVFGGIIRDVLSNEVPFIFRKEIYAFACVSGAIIYLTLLQFNMAVDIAMIISVVVVIAIRLLAMRYAWSIPFVPYANRKK